MKTDLVAQVYTGRGQNDEYVHSYRPNGRNQPGSSDGLGQLLFSFVAIVLTVIGGATVLRKGPQVTKWMQGKVKKTISVIWDKCWKFIVGAVGGIVIYQLYFRH